MPKLIVSIDGVVIKEVQLTQDRTTLGRRPYNDIVIDNLAVSGEHAVVEVSDEGVFVQDKGSTNGTYLNGQPITRQRVQPGDLIEIGKYRITLAPETEHTAEASTAAPAPALSTDGSAGSARIRVLAGGGAGREVPLVKAVTTIGKPGVAVAAITRNAGGYEISHVEGHTHVLLHGVPVVGEPVALADGDTFELAGTRMQFVQGDAGSA